eukprot:CAMPEP_0197624048 /NCGR_PEP_ID=MMETSP1338-20131121/3859_1 /TAXON_ID=43686 ORGANISM="Pelagodinium beii, Strain RCC1491" /NCGR_SAMPLE_ID=MMETSP1338 /ASSEMBLY_ACC=CAM_ASM_000754 /LENGTH=374 /DNA_ID=CAMNT_0043194145 /DNA_START=113 /DNA_END=1237 /DNA_ORIENTATION=-
MKSWTGLLVMIALLEVDAANLRMQTLRREQADVDTDSMDSLVSMVESDMLTNNKVFVQDGFQVSGHMSVAAPAPGSAPAPGPAPASGPARASAPATAPAPASAAAPAPGPASGPSPRPAEVTTTTASTESTTTTVAKPTTKITRKITGIDYSLLQSDEKLLAGFERSLRVVLAAEAGVKDSDVTLELSPGSVIVTATIVVPEGGTETVSPDKVKEKLCSSKDLNDEMTSVLSDLEGIGAVTSADIKIEEVSSDCPTTTTSSEPPKAAEKEVQAPAAPNVTDTSGDCSPGCMADRGVCGGGSCFCKHPYTGDQCELEVEQEFMRFSFFAVTVIVLISVVVGFIVADILWRLFSKQASPKSSSTGATQKSEKWSLK